MILGLDPGARSGWCLYDPTARRAIECGEFLGFDYAGMDGGARSVTFSDAVIERPKGYGPTRPQLVDCGYVAGRLVERVARSWRLGMVHEMTRLEVCKALTAAVHAQINVRNDATAWAALLELHGGVAAGSKGTRKKGIQFDPPGRLGIVTGHARAALAVAVAFAISRGDLK